ncbi:Hypothetical_protein [Hexamita inflata]|uniref:Hypothetical_protein n=1 Tax=Hexamita inflata TaxID=28002 RepID=A0AA86UNF5_9EUKA|nr:Hypothetical protein HINF_LOCUS45841 [Hexamita inflata]
MSQNLCEYCHQTMISQKLVQQTQQLQALLPSTSALIQKHYNKVITSKQQVVDTVVAVNHTNETIKVQLENKEVQTNEFVLNDIPIKEVVNEQNLELDSRLSNQATVIQAQTEEIEILKNKLTEQAQSYIEETQNSNKLQAIIHENNVERDKLLYQISRMKAEISFLQEQMK